MNEVFWKDLERIYADEDNRSFDAAREKERLRTRKHFWLRMAALAFALIGVLLVTVVLEHAHRAHAPVHRTQDQQALDRLIENLR